QPGGGRVALGERGEVRGQQRLIGRRLAGDELPDADAVEERRRPVLRQCGDGGARDERSGGERRANREWSHDDPPFLESAIDDRDAWRRGESQIRRAVSTGRLSRAFGMAVDCAFSGASNATTSAGAPTGRIWGACGVLLPSSTTARGTLARPLRRQSFGSEAVMAAPAASWH